MRAVAANSSGVIDRKIRSQSIAEGEWVREGDRKMRGLV